MKQTVGAISGHFPSSAQRAINTSLAEDSIGAQIARQVDAAEALAPLTFLGHCVVCETDRYGVTGTPCGRCEMYRAKPDQYRIGDDGTWWAV